MAKIQRIFYLNQPGTKEAFNYLYREVNRFISREKAFEFRYQVRFDDGEGFKVNTAFIKVYAVNPEIGPDGEWDLFGFYNIGEIKRFESDLARRSKTNPTGAVELTNNELYNGLFNIIPNKLDGWEIDTDSTSGTLTIKSKGDRMEITSDGTGEFLIINTRTALVNLVEYTVTTNVFEITGTANVKILIGSTEGGSRTVKGVFNETIVGGGADVFIKGNIISPDAKITLDFILINGN